jgi:ABC-type uncharacterized transport system YnjBCD ATPase subunit
VGRRRQAIADRIADHALEVARLIAVARSLSVTWAAAASDDRMLPRGAPMLFDEPQGNLDAALRKDMRIEMMELIRREASTVGWPSASVRSA